MGHGAAGPGTPEGRAAGEDPPGGTALAVLLGSGPPSGRAPRSQTAMAMSTVPPCWATTVRSAVPPGTSARRVQVPSAA